MTGLNNPSGISESGETRKPLPLSSEGIAAVAAVSKAGIKNLLLHTPSVKEIFGSDDQKFIEFAKLLKQYGIKTIDLDAVIENREIKQVGEE